MILFFHADGLRDTKILKEVHHMNFSKAIALEFAILTFEKNLPNMTIHIQIDSKIAQNNSQPRTFEN